MSHARKAALHLLNSDWSRGVWKHWLSNIFLPPVEPPLPTTMPPPAVVEPAATAAPTPPRITSPQPVSPPSNERANTLGAADASTTDRASVSEPPDSQAARDIRRGELRARFEALSDRLMAVEDGLVLADEVAKHDDVSEALAAFTARRFERARMVVENSVRIGEIEMAGGNQMDANAMLGDTMHKLQQPY